MVPGLVTTRENLEKAQTSFGRTLMGADVNKLKRMFSDEEFVRNVEAFRVAISDALSVAEREAGQMMAMQEARRQLLAKDKKGK